MHCLKEVLELLSSKRKFYSSQFTIPKSLQSVKDIKSTIANTVSHPKTLFIHLFAWDCVTQSIPLAEGNADPIYSINRGQCWPNLFH